MTKGTRCEICGKKITALIIDVGSTDTICMECSGVTLDDLLKDDLDERVDQMRTFHGKSQYD